MKSAGKYDLSFEIKYGKRVVVAAHLNMLLLDNHIQVLFKFAEMVSLGFWQVATMLSPSRVPLLRVFFEHFCFLFMF